MKVGIVTIQDDLNYGNRLQNNAVSEIMISYGVEVKTIVIKNKEDLISSHIKRFFLKKIMELLPIHLLCFCSLCKRGVFGDYWENVRARKFHAFNDQHIPMDTYYVNRFEQLLHNKALQDYDYFMAGSDQIWNPDWGLKDLFFLTFVPPRKRIAFIASMGVSEVVEQQTEHFAELLQQMNYISVREEAAVKIVKQLTGRDADCFFDPVLLVERDHWLKIEEAVPFQIPSRYILSFFLESEPKEEIEAFANSRKVEVIHLNQKECKKYYCINPVQFLYLIHHAEYVLTDSFHGTAFSIIFEKQFWAFQRRGAGMERMFSRIETLLGRLGLMDRIWCVSAMEEITPISERQYDRIRKTLTDERERLDEKMKKLLRG